MNTKVMTRDEAARHLAELQTNLNPTLHVYRVTSSDPQTEQSDSEPLKLLYVNEFTFPIDEIWPLGFEPTAASGNFPTIIIDVSPEQFDQIRDGKLRLPHDWKLGEELIPTELPNVGPKL